MSINVREATPRILRLLSTKDTNVAILLVDRFKAELVLHENRNSNNKNKNKLMARKKYIIMTNRIRSIPSFSKQQTNKQTNAAKFLGETWRNIVMIKRLSAIRLYIRLHYIKY